MKIFKDRFILFTDASVDGKVDMKNGNRVMGGCCLYDSLINKFSEVELFPYNKATNNFGEMISIFNAAKKCIRIYNSTGIQDFTIMSDSQYCIYSFRDWVYNWYKNVGRNGNYRILTSSGNDLKNRFLIDNFISMIAYSNIRIKLIHVSGHTDTVNKNIIDVFIKSNLPYGTNLNSLQRRNLYNELKYLLQGNIKVDNITRAALGQYYAENDASLFEQKRMAFAPTYELMKYYKSSMASRQDILNALF